MTKAELVELIKENFYNEEEDLIDISDLEFDCNVVIDGMKVKGNLHQSSQKVGGDLFQNWHEVKGDLFQDNHKVKGDLYQNRHKVGGRIIEGGHRKTLKKITKEELEKLGYELDE